MRSFQVFAAMSGERAAAFMRALDEKLPGVFAQTVAATASAMKARPVYLQRQPFEKRAEAVRRALSRVSANDAASELLAGYFLQVRNDLLVEWLDLLGIEHDKGSLAQDELPEPPAERLHEAVTKYRAAAEDPDRELLLQAFAAQDAVDWPGLEALIRPAPLIHGPHYNRGVADGFERLRAAGWRWLVRRSARAEIEASLFPHLLAGEAGERVIVARPRRGRSFHALDSARGGLFVKRIALPAGVAAAWRRYRSRARGAREMRRAAEAHARGAPTPEPLALGVRGRGLSGGECLLVYRRLAARPLAALAASPPARARVLAALAASTALMHERGVFHMDVTAANLLLSGDPEGAFVLAAADLESLELGRAGDLARSARALGRMAAKLEPTRASERLRFLDAYLARRAGLAVDRRALWRAAAREAARHAPARARLASPV